MPLSKQILLMQQAIVQNLLLAEIWEKKNEITQDMT